MGGNNRKVPKIIELFKCPEALVYLNKIIIVVNKKILTFKLQTLF